MLSAPYMTGSRKIPHKANKYKWRLAQKCRSATTIVPTWV